MKDVIRSFLFVNAIQRPQVFQFRQRIHARTAQFYRDVSDIRACRLILVSLWGNQDYFKAVIGVTVDDITPEVDEVTEAVVGEENFLHRNVALSFLDILRHPLFMHQTTQRFLRILSVNNLAPLSIK